MPAGNLLLVDDDMINQEVALALLEGTGLVTDVAGRQAAVGAPVLV